MTRYNDILDDSRQHLLDARLDYALNRRTKATVRAHEQSHRRLCTRVEREAREAAFAAAWELSEGECTDVECPRCGLDAIASREHEVMETLDSTRNLQEVWIQAGLDVVRVYCPECHYETSEDGVTWE